MKSTLFLGAGASCFASHPTTKVLLEKVQKKIEETMKEDKQQFVKKFLEEPELDDIEKVYDCVNKIIMLDKPYSSVIAHKMNYCNDVQIDYPNMVEALNELKSIIRDVLLESFQPEHKKNHEIKKVYDIMWSIIQNHGSTAFQIITTNYDLVLDQYCDANWELVDSFNHAINAQPRYWKNTWEPHTGKPALYLVRLHGSISWQKNENEILHASMPGIRAYESDVMILPTLGPKDYNHPFDKLKYRFIEILDDTDLLIVVGFSYRDPEINKIIKSRLSEGMQIISISPEPEQLREISNQDKENITIGGLPFSKFGASVFAYKTEFGPKTVNDIRIVI